LTRPERRNAFDAELIRELTEAFDEVGDARAVVLAGDGESFCAGADVDWQRSAIDLSYEENVEDALVVLALHADVVASPDGNSVVKMHTYSAHARRDVDFRGASGRWHRRAREGKSQCAQHHDFKWTSHDAEF